MAGWPTKLAKSVASLGQLGAPCVSRHKLKANEATITSTNTHKRGSNLQLNYDEMGNRKGINCPRNAIMLSPRFFRLFFFFMRCKLNVRINERMNGIAKWDSPAVQLWLQLNGIAY